MGRCKAWYSRGHRVLGVLFTLGFSWSISGCLGDTSPRAGTPSTLSASYPSHTSPLHGTDLRQLMHALDHSIYDDEEISELERDEIRREYVFRMAEQIERLAGEIAQTSWEVGHPFTVEEQQAYRSYADTLRYQGQQLKGVAQFYAVEEYPRLRAEIIETCDRCHVQFRDAF